MDTHIELQVGLALVGSAVFPLVILQNNHAELVDAFAGRFGVARVLVRSAAPHTFVLVSEPVPRLQCMRNSGLHPLWGKPGSWS